jgi:hypothetical protein
MGPPMGAQVCSLKGIVVRLAAVIDDDVVSTVGLIHVDLALQIAIS